MRSPLGEAERAMSLSLIVGGQASYASRLDWCKTLGKRKGLELYGAAKGGERRNRGPGAILGPVKAFHVKKAALSQKPESWSGWGGRDR